MRSSVIDASALPACPGSAELRGVRSEALQLSRHYTKKEEDPVIWGGRAGPHCRDCVTAEIRLVSEASIGDGEHLHFVPGEKIPLLKNSPSSR